MRDEELSLEEEIRLADVNRGALMDWWFAYRQVQDGVIEPDAIPIGSWRRWFHDLNPRMHESWADFKLTVSEDADFIRFMEENVVNAR